MNTKRLLERSYAIAYGNYKFVAKIREELFQKQLKAVNSTVYEKRKDMWNELFIRLYKEIYFLDRVIMQGMSKYYDTPFEKSILKVTKKYEIDNIEAMKSLYIHLYNNTNKRVFRLEKYAKSLLDGSEIGSELHTDMNNALDLFSRVVKPCVMENYKNQARYVNIDCTLDDAKKAIDEASYDTINVINFKGGILWKSIATQK